MNPRLSPFDVSLGCGCPDSDPSRRDFLARTSCALLAALAASGVLVGDARAFPVTIIEAIAGQGTEHSYPIPSGDGVSIDTDNDVILVRQGNRIYAFSLACPHENTALRWRPQDQRFQCPRHESKYQPDGTFISGRATRNMDRLAIRVDGKNVVVDIAKLYRSDQQNAAWDSAVATL